MVAVTAAVVAAAWAVSWAGAAEHDRLLMRQLRGAAPTEWLAYLALSGTMMVAMMLPSALPMVATYRGLVSGEGASEARLRTLLFTSAYFAVWAAFTALALVALAAFGLMGRLVGPAVFVPGALLALAGAYQLTGWKRFCLQHCRSPLAFVMTHWRPGRSGAVRMGLGHAVYCLGCCWLLMLVLFTAGAMSVLWMGVFTLLVLAEKVGSWGERVALVTGVVALAVGVATLGLAAATSPLPPLTAP